MGKGGQKEVVQTSSKGALLAHLSDAELRKYADEFGVKCDQTRAGLLKGLDPYDRAILEDTPKCLPLQPPPFTLKEIRDAIPQECFKRDMLKSFSHLASDLAVIAGLFYFSTYIDSLPIPTWARYLVWAAYWFCQGTVATGVWVIAHECGHQAFSDSERVNNFVGWVLHSALLVPYHSWRISHGKHHNNTGSCENDEVFNPPTRSDYKEELLDVTPIFNAFQIVVMLTVGWMPGYLFFNFTGPAKYRGKSNSHFNPNSALFDDKDKMDIVVSVVGFLLAVGTLGYLGNAYGWLALSKYYGVPYMIVNLYLVLITYLQHTDVYIPHFKGEEWSWLRGALCTVDRTFGAVIDHTIHHIADTHVCHHLFSKMPFYNAQKATLAIKNKIGKYYLKDDTPIGKALWRSYQLCKFVEDDEKIVFYKYKTN
mmetsp:Transcript_53877/g.78686  ORF Transcript_53877/g.78686 Transcript_53877/m.78686 type:complete len:424 (+) Transcript_53877:131-1402(+)|eukprot:CAMPEP_0194589060 /NCGR_PEP_ID=MMETSP0292-20121207/20305_1 /TAXON_ID=39354 /ORGANISM="Heterosigma akashiwo, Strain CCMP2393" /LENGTH=423 /DNA_ID=CAMNT_0039445991 /DNA_START=104 /DNA_END=1375 /DNA_ORIENTATION=-